MSNPSPSVASSIHRVCPQCARVAALGRRFCGGCRALLVRACGACGFGNERDDVWCGGCGVSLSSRASAGAPVGPPSVAAPRPPPVPHPGPAIVRSPVPARDKPAVAAAPSAIAVAATPSALAVADLLAINKRRTPLVGPSDASDQDSLDQLFGESR